MVGSTARLDCAITPGVLIEYYYVTWRNASDPSVMFYLIPPRNNESEPQEHHPLNHWYTINQNFSLFISNVGPADTAEYQCVLGVVDPSDFTAYNYTRTQNANIRFTVLVPRKLENEFEQNTMQLEPLASFLIPGLIFTSL